MLFAEAKGIKHSKIHKDECISCWVIEHQTNKQINLEIYILVWLSVYQVKLILGSLLGNLIHNS